MSRLERFDLRAAEPAPEPLTPEPPALASPAPPACGARRPEPCARCPDELRCPFRALARLLAG